MCKFALVVAVLLGLAAPAAAQQCFIPYDKLVSAAKERHGEQPLAEFDLDGREGQRIVIFVNPTTQSVTFVLVTPEGMACTPVGGSGFRVVGPVGRPS